MTENSRLFADLAAVGLGTSDDPEARESAELLEDQGLEALAAFARTGVLTTTDNAGFYDAGRHGALLRRICARAGLALHVEDAYVDAADGLSDLVLLARVGDQELAFHRGPGHDVLAEAHVGLVVRAATECLKLGGSDWFAGCLLDDTELMFLTLPPAAHAWLTGKDGRAIRRRLAEDLDLEEFAWAPRDNWDPVRPLPPAEARRLLG